MTRRTNTGEEFNIFILSLNQNQPVLDDVAGNTTMGIPTCVEGYFMDIAILTSIRLFGDSLASIVFGTLIG